MATATSLLLVLLLFFLPLGPSLLRPLEQAVPQPELPEKIDGFIVLGGVFNATLTAAYKKPQLGEDAERVTEMIALARQYPRAKVIFSGGFGLLRGEVMPEAEVLRAFLEGQGVTTSTLILEDKSRNTHENAIYSKERAQPREAESWVLITSAFHMPRAYGAFRKAGWQVIPYPVSYRVKPQFGWEESGYHYAELAIHEWVGLVAYWLSGRM